MLEIALQVNAKLTEFKAMQMTVVSLLEEPATVELVDTTKECVNQMEKDLIALKADFVKFTKKIKEILKSQKETTSGSGTSHKSMLGACWGLRPHLRKSCLILR